MPLTEKEWGILEGLLRRRIRDNTSRATRKRPYLSQDLNDLIDEKITDLLNLLEKIKEEKSKAENHA